MEEVGRARRHGRDDLALVREELVGICFAVCGVGSMAEIGSKDQAGF